MKTITVLACTWDNDYCTCPFRVDEYDECEHPDAPRENSVRDVESGTAPDWCPLRTQDVLIQAGDGLRKI